MCIINEHHYVLSAQSALTAEPADFSGFAKAVNHSHENLRDLYDISCPEIDWLLKRVQELDSEPDDLRNPVNCGRITGKGFGRCLYAIIRQSDEEKFKKKILEFEKIFQYHPEVYEVVPSEGTVVIKD